MSSRLGWRRFLPGKRRDRRDDIVIKAIPISEAGPFLHEEDTDSETQQYHGQQQYVLSLGPLFIDSSYLVLLAIPWRKHLSIFSQ
jgi:hypothetical protein